MKKKKLIITITLGIVAVVLGAFLYLSLHIEGRYRIGAKLGFVTADTSLHEAAGRGQKDTVEQLVANGCDVNGKDRWGQTPLLIAAGSGNTNVAEFLIAKGADVDAECRSRWMQGRWWKHRTWLTRSLEWTPLHAAADREHWGMVDLLLAHGAHVNAQNDNGSTPLHLATDERVAERLVAKGANVNAKDKSGETPLHKMVGRQDVAELLIDNGADVNARDKDGLAVLDYAVMTELVGLLIAKGANATIHSTACTGEATKLRALTEEGADVNARDKFGQTALHLASFGGHKRLVDLLLVNPTFTVSRGKPPF